MAVITAFPKPEGDKTFVTPNTTVEVTDNSGNKTYKKVGDLSDEEKSAFERRGTGTSGASLTGRTSNPVLFAVSDIVNKSTPQIKVNDAGTGLVLTGTKEALDSELGNQLQKYLNDTFKYADLSSQNVLDAINTLNNDLYSQMEQRASEGLLGTNYDDYKEYKNTMQQFQGTNPLTSTAAVPGYTKDGRKIKATDDDKKTIADWLKYYQDNYNATERARLFEWSYKTMLEQMRTGENVDFATWTPYLVMAGGYGDKPVYGFNTGERIAAGVKALINEGAGRLIEGINQGALRATQAVLGAADYNDRNVLSSTLNSFGLTGGRGQTVKASQLPWMTKEQFDKRLEGIEGKSFNQLPNDLRVIILAAAQDAVGGKTRKAIMNDFLDDGKITADTLSKISYDKYMSERHAVSVTEKYDKEMDKASEALSEGRAPLQRAVDASTLYAPTELTIGSFVGTMMRMWAEAGLIGAATGGAFNPAAISDKLANGFTQLLAPTGSTLKALQTPVGEWLLSLTMELPEDVVQTAIDDTLTNRAGDIVKLAPTGNLQTDMEKLGESFAQNLRFRLIFSLGKESFNAARNVNAAKKAARGAKLDNKINLEDFSKEARLKDAADSGNVIDVTKDSATIRNPDGTETVLDNVAMLHFGTDAELKERYPAVYEMMRKKGLTAEDDLPPEKAKIFDDADAMAERVRERAEIPQADLDNGANIAKYFEDYDTVRVDDPDSVNRIIDSDIPQFMQRGWFADSGDLLRPAEARDVMAIAALRNPELRNAALNKAYDVYYRINQDAAPLSFDEWVNTPITLYRRSFAGEGVGDERANFLSYSMKEGGLSEKGHGTEIDTITIAPKDTTGLLMGADSLVNRFADEGEMFVPTAIIEGHPKYLSIGDIVDAKNAENNATMDAVPSSASYSWESPDVTKTYTSAEEVFADRPVGKNMTEVKQWQKNAEAFFMDRYAERTAPIFAEKYPTIDEQQQFVRNMDFLFDQQRIEGETIETAVGKTYENEGITYTVKQEDIDFYNENVESIMKDLREAGAAGQGKEAFTITGYLPHSDYDPSLLTAEDSMQQGVLWREYTGASTTAEDGSFSTGWLNPDLEARYRTFVNNMLWDSLGDEVMVAKYMEEFNADGLDVTANNVEKLVGGRKRLADIVSKSDSAKAVVKNLTGNGDLPKDADIEATAKKLGSTDAVHGLYRDIYGSSSGLNQRGSVSLMSKSDWMRSLTTGDGSLYDNGGAMIVNSSSWAKYMTKQIFDAVENGEQVDARQMFIDFLTQNNRRTAKGAGYIADKWMNKLTQKAEGGITRREFTATLSNMIYGEGANRLFRFVGRMDTSKLNAANRQALDSLLYRHSVLSKIMNTSGFSAKLNKAANNLIAARMKSLFWLNYKNGVLQSSECIRIFTEFKLGDALQTIKRLATDKAFRDEADDLVDMIVPERYIKGDSEAATGAMKTIADNAEYKDGTLTVKKMSSSDLKKLATDFDQFASSPVEMGEAMKNRVIMAGILQETERMGLSGNEKFNYINQRFERIGLAANEMGRLNASDNPLFRIGANLKTFQIRQFRMFLNNIQDMNGKSEAVTYILKNLGWKAGLAMVMAKLGYSAAATLGIDPFDLMDDDYTGVDEENYTGLDYAMLSPVAKLFLSGGFTSYISDAYWAARKAYEDNATVTEQTEERVDKNFIPGFAVPGLSFDNVLDAFGGFIPGFTAGKRVVQMNELLDAGWATSATGNRMYEAPTSPIDIATGYIFGRSNTPQARAYYQTPDYLQGLATGGLAGLGQQIGRELSGEFRQFDPIDTRNYSDWFDGTAADEQQWNSGYYYFLDKVQQMQNEYQTSLQSYTTDQDKEQLRQSFNERIAEVEEQLRNFTTAYERKHPNGIDARKMRNLINILNLYQPVMTDTEEEANERSLDAYSQALSRYTQAGLPAVTSYKRNDEGEVEEVYSPQLRSALQGEFGLPEEAAAQIRKLYNDKWKDLGKQYRDRVFSTKGTKNKQAIQNEYINIVRQDLDPIVELYGNNIWSNEDVENIIDDVFNSMIPKYGQSAKSYLKGIYKDSHGQLRYTERSNETISRIRSLLDEGRTAQAKALGRTLLQRVQENRTSVTRDELEWLQGVLND